MTVAEIHFCSRRDGPHCNSSRLILTRGERRGGSPYCYHLGDTRPDQTWTLFIGFSSPKAADHMRRQSWDLYAQSATCSKSSLIFESQAKTSMWVSHLCFWTKLGRPHATSVWRLLLRRERHSRKAHSLLSRGPKRAWVCLVGFFDPETKNHMGRHI
jgi:hypothetical protein